MSASKIRARALFTARPCLHPSNISMAWIEYARPRYINCEKGDF